MCPLFLSFIHFIKTKIFISDTCASSCNGRCLLDIWNSQLQINTMMFDWISLPLFPMEPISKHLLNMKNTNQHSPSQIHHMLQIKVMFNWQEVKVHIDFKWISDMKIAFPQGIWLIFFSIWIWVDYKNIKVEWYCASTLSLDKSCSNIGVLIDSFHIHKIEPLQKISHCIHKTFFVEMDSENCISTKFWLKRLFYLVGRK